VFSCFVPGRRRRYLRTAWRLAVLIVTLALMQSACSLFEPKRLPPDVAPAEPARVDLFGNRVTQPIPSAPPMNTEADVTNGPRLGVNRFLWQGALDTVSFMPLVSADPFGGLIITDWYAPPETPQERFKLNVYILGRDLRADAVRVAVFHQQQTDGQWRDVPTATTTATDLEDAILGRAQRLRGQALGTGEGS